MPSQIYPDGQLILNGKYRILKMIGEGASAQVFLAQHVRMGNALRALKVLRRGIAGAGSTEIEDYRRRFELEAALMAELGHHDGIVQAFDMDAEGGPEGETLILALEYMPGGSLEIKLATAGKPLPVAEVVRILREIAEALCHLHARDVVHRDLKPGNILLDAAGRANITDLGLAQVPNSLSMRTRTFSEWREYHGTPQYMSPEQQNSRAYLTPASDCYTLGLMAFEMLTARVTRNQPPGTRVRQLQANCPTWLDDLIAALLQPDPYQRLWNAQQVVARLQAGEAALAAEVATAKAAQQAEPAADVGGQRQVLTQHRRQTEAAFAAARWVEAMRHARAWLALQPDDTRAREVLRRAEEEQSKLTHARTRRALLLGGGAAGVLGLGYVASRLVPTGSGAANATPRSTDMPLAATAAPATPMLRPTDMPLAATAAPATPMLRPTDRPPTATAAPATLTPRPTDVPPTATAAPATLIPTSSSIKRLSDNLVEMPITPNIAMQFVRVTASEFVMGSDKTKDPQAYDDELPQHRLSLPEYWMGKTPVTVAQFAAFVKATGYKTQAEKYSKSWVWIGSEWKEIVGADWVHPQGPSSGVGQKQNHPVTQVSWDDGMAYVKWVSEVSKAQVSLPNEAEWEKAARGAATSSGADRIYPWGNEAPDATRCNFNNNEKDTTPVSKYGARGASPYGCDDMAGNVWEWTRSEYKDYPYKLDDSIESIQNAILLVVRGGAFLNAVKYVRCAYRFSFQPNFRYNGIGFRVMMSPPL